MVPLLNKTYFGGGTVLASTSTERYIHTEREREREKQINNNFVNQISCVAKGCSREV